MNIFMKLHIVLAFFIFNSSYAIMRFEPVSNIQLNKAEARNCFEYHVKELKKQYKEADACKILNTLKDADVVEFKKNPRIVRLAEQRVIALQKKRILQGPILNYLQQNEQRNTDTMHENSTLLSVLDLCLKRSKKNLKVAFENEEELIERFQVKLFRLVYQEEMLNSCAWIAWNQLKENGQLTKTLESDWCQAMTEKKHVIDIGDQCKVQSKIISITPSTRLGTMYALQEVKKITEFAHKNNLFIHMDGVRLNNAAVNLKVMLAAIWKNGINMCPRGWETKDGTMMPGKAVALSNKELSKNFQYLRKPGSGQISKIRFIWAQCITFLANNLWFKNEQHANAIAQFLYLITNDCDRVKMAIWERILPLVDFS